MADILVVDDDQSVAEAFQRFLGYEGHACRLASNAEDAVRMIDERRPALVMMDIRMPGVDGLQALQQIRNRFPDVYVVMMTGYGTSQTSIDAIRAGAFDYLTKPLDLEEIQRVIRKALDSQVTLGSTASTAPIAEIRPILVGETPAMREVYKTIGRLATIDVPALVVGEHGSGKTLVVQTIHENSARRGDPFRAIACATTPETVLRAEIFGATAGTLLLSAIESLPLALQVELGQALAASSGRSAVDHALAARIIASSTSDLNALVSSDTFHRELHGALSLITLRIPPLRSRREDIPLLVRHFIQRFNADFDRTIRGVDDRVMRTLMDYTWPGNVGELERVVKRGAILARSDVITADDVGESMHRRPQTGGEDAESALVSAARTALQERLVDGPQQGSESVYHDLVEMVEMALAKEALIITNGNQVKAATILGVNRATLRKKMPADADDLSG
jgi:two-component system nitrogen regulation response regulator GlnG